ncbi:MAG: hypothetical protein IKM44_05190, partial [Clostridia bacterium]|nr:hypothetical protein [Clostridia bacterium]
IILTSLGTWGLPQMVQKFYAIKSEGAIKKGMIISTIFALIVAGGCYFLGGFGRLFYTPGEAGIKFDEIIPSMIETSLPIILIALVLVLVVSASMSTLSSLVMTSSSTIVLDFINGNIKKNMSQKGQMFSIRFFIGVFIVLSALIAIIYETFNLSFIAQMMGVSWGALAGSFLAPYLYSLYWKKTTKQSCWACFAFGTIISIVSMIVSLNNASLSPEFLNSFIYVYFFQSPVYVGAWTMLIGFIIVPIVSLFSKPKNDALVAELFASFTKHSEAVESVAEPYLNKLDDESDKLQTENDSTEMS